MKPLNHNPRRIAKSDKAFKDIKLPVKIRNIHNIGVSFFGNKDKKKDLIYVSKKCCEDVDLSLIDKGDKKALRSYQRFQYFHV